MTAPNDSVEIGRNTTRNIYCYYYWRVPILDGPLEGQFFENGNESCKLVLCLCVEIPTLVLLILQFSARKISSSNSAHKWAWFAPSSKSFFFIILFLIGRPFEIVVAFINYSITLSPNLTTLISS